jgi:hypothetical protein
MKMTRMITLCAMALALSAGTLLAQDNGGNGGGNGGGQGGANGGGRGGRGGRNFDPAQMQQRIMDGVRDELNFTNDTDWSAVQPLVQKVLDGRRDVGNTQMNMMRLAFGGGRNRGGDQGGDQNGGQRRNRGGGFSTPSPEQTALQNAVDQNAPAAQVKDLLAKYEATQAAKKAKLVQAQADLRAVLTPTQEAQATLLGLLD